MSQDREMRELARDLSFGWAPASRFQAYFAIRRYCRKLTLLDMLLRRGIWISKSNRQFDDQTELARLGQQIRMLRGVIGKVMNALPDFYSLPAVRKLNIVGPRIALAAHHYLTSLNFMFDLTGYRGFVGELAKTWSLDYEEVRLALSSLELCCLTELYEAYAERIIPQPSGESRVDKVVMMLQLMQTTETGNFVGSLVSYEGMLEQDPSRVYRLQDEKSKDLYRRSVTKLARQCGCAGDEIAQTALTLSRERLTVGAGAVAETHIGYYLLDRGLSQLLDRVTVQRGRSAKLRALDQGLSAFYNILLMTSTLCLICASLVYFNPLQLPLPWSLLSIASLVVITSEAANAAIDAIALLFVRKRQAPELDFRMGIPESQKTIVCVPTLLIDERHVRQLLGNLEGHYLTTRDRNVVFALLTDYSDADQATPTDSDRGLLAQCMEGVRVLNARYADAPFYVFHRERRYCETQKQWIGWERKRGKLRLLNRLVAFGINEFESVQGDMASLGRVRYVCVVDDNAELSPFGVQRLVGFLEHPLNQAVVNGISKKLDRGYVIVQPALCMTERSASMWPCCEAIVGPVCDSNVSSSERRNIYFDIFGRTGFFGEGLYDPTAFEEILQESIPSGRVLSHDTIEGGCLRTAFIGHQAIRKSCPSSFNLYYLRQHRWVRGDWQNLMLSLSPRRLGKSRTNSLELSPLARYMIFRFTRRSVVPLARVFILSSVLLSSGDIAAVRLMLYFAVLLMPDYAGLSAAAISLLAQGRLIYLKDILWRRFCSAHCGALIWTVTAVHQSIVALDAIAQTVWRIFAGRKLLEWKSSSHTESEKIGFNKMDLYAWVALAVSLVGTLLLHRSPLGWAIGTLWSLNIIVFHKLVKRPTVGAM